MKIAITSNGGSMEAQFSPRFGRCTAFIIVDTETREWKSYPNPAIDARGGAGPQAVQFIANQGIRAIVSGRFGPSAYTALQAGGIQTYIAKSGTVEEVFEAYLAGKLEQDTAATGGELHGRGRHRGRRR
jgi:predicted Fe-Mo cluster-binding NifX family protein